MSTTTSSSERDTSTFKKPLPSLPMLQKYDDDVVSPPDSCLVSSIIIVFGAKLGLFVGVSERLSIIVDDPVGLPVANVGNAVVGE